MPNITNHPKKNTKLISFFHVFVFLHWKQKKNTDNDRYFFLSSLNHNFVMHLRRICVQRNCGWYEFMCVCVYFFFIFSETKSQSRNACMEFYFECTYSGWNLNYGVSWRLNAYANEKCNSKHISEFITLGEVINYKFTSHTIFGNDFFFHVHV